MGDYGGNSLETALKRNRLKDGDRNKGFFDRMASAHHRNNSLKRIKINGEWLRKEQEIRE